MPTCVCAIIRGLYSVQQCLTGGGEGGREIFGYLFNEEICMQKKIKLTTQFSHTTVPKCHGLYH